MFNCKLVCKCCYVVVAANIAYLPKCFISLVNWFAIGFCSQIAEDLFCLIDLVATKIVVNFVALLLVPLLHFTCWFCFYKSLQITGVKLDCKCNFWMSHLQEEALPNFLKNLHEVKLSVWHAHFFTR